MSIAAELVFESLYGTWLIVFPLTVISLTAKLQAVLWLLLLSVEKRMDAVKCSKLYLSCSIPAGDTQKKDGVRGLEIFSVTLSRL